MTTFYQNIPDDLMLPYGISAQLYSCETPRGLFSFTQSALYTLLVDCPGWNITQVIVAHWYTLQHNIYGPLARCAKLRVAHAPKMSWTLSPPPRVSDLDMHHGTCVTHVSWCMPRSLTSGFLWIWWRGKRSRHSRRMRNPQIYVSGKRPIVVDVTVTM